MNTPTTKPSQKRGQQRKPKGQKLKSKPPRKKKAMRKSKPQQQARKPKSANHGARHSAGIGSTIGAGLGSWAEKGIRALIGSGDYAEEHAASGLDVEANSIVQPMTASQVPIFSTPEHLHGAVRVAHREYIGDIISGDSASDSVGSFQITPMNPQLFPWLSTIAQNFQQWTPCGIVFEFVSTAGNAVSGTAAPLGDVNFVCSYDIEAPPLTTKAQMLNSFYATSACTTQNLMMAVECAPDDQVVSNYYCQQPGFSPYYDARLNVLGDFLYRNTGSLSKYTVGQLWVTYEIVLLKPRVFVPPSLSNSRFTQRQISMLSEAAMERGTPLSPDQVLMLTKVQNNSEEKDTGPSVMDELELIIAEGLLVSDTPQSPLRPRPPSSQPIDIPHRANGLDDYQLIRPGSMSVPNLMRNI
jgi:hypothetical protein